MTPGLKILICMFAAAFVAGVVLVVLPGNSKAPSIPQTTSTTKKLPPVTDVTVRMLSKTSLQISGSMSNTWYFEATFPVELLDATSAVIARAPAQAKTDWTLPGLVPFLVTLSFPPQPAGSSGTVIFKKDNPSGDPSRDDSVSAPVVFQ